MSVKVIGAGVGRTGTHSLKQALEQLLGGRCHHMVEIIGDPPQAAAWTDAVEGREVDWQQVLDGYVAMVDWPGASFWREISAANPDALVLLSTRDPEAWYRSAAEHDLQSDRDSSSGSRGVVRRDDAEAVRPALLRRPRQPDGDDGGVRGATTPRCAQESRRSGCSSGQWQTAGSRSASTSACPSPASPSRSRIRPLRRVSCSACPRWADTELRPE